MNLDLHARQSVRPAASGGCREGTIPCAPGFELWRSLAFVRGFSPMMAEQSVASDTLTKALVHRGQTVTFTVRQASSALAYRLSSDRRIDSATEAAAAAHITAFLSAQEDMTSFHRRAAADPCFAPVAARLAGLHHVRFPTPFEAACWATLNQRCHLTQARAMKHAICRQLGGVARLGGDELLAFPEAATIVAAGDEALRRAVPIERKAQVVMGVARAFAKVDEAFLRSAPVPEVEAWLHDIRGVGPFTSGFVLFRGLGRFARPAMSPKLLLAAKRVYGPTLQPADLQRLSAGYGPWAGHWALYLWASGFDGLLGTR